MHKDYVYEIIDILAFKNKIKKFPNKLSAGQQQRVAIARALNNEIAKMADVCIKIQDAKLLSQTCNLK